MLDLVRDESFRLDSRFLEPACGDGNFLIEILRRKLSLLQDLKSQTEWEFQSLIAVGSCYGIDILPDNAEACRTRLEEYVLSQHPAPETFGSTLIASERRDARSAVNTIQAKRSVVTQCGEVRCGVRSVVQCSAQDGDLMPCGRVRRQPPRLLHPHRTDGQHGAGGVSGAPPSPLGDAYL